MDNEAVNTTKAARMQRDALMTLLIAQCQGLIQQLALLAGSEKTAVAGLVSVGQAMAAYARAAQPDPEVIASFDRELTALSPGYWGRFPLIMTREHRQDRVPAAAGGAQEVDVQFPAWAPPYPSRAAYLQDQ